MLWGLSAEPGGSGKTWKGAPAGSVGTGELDGAVGVGFKGAETLHRWLFALPRFGRRFRGGRL